MIIGIDPGITGAIAFIHTNWSKVEDIPVMANGKGKTKVKNKVNGSALAEMLTNYDLKTATVYLERVSSMPGQGVASMFSMGDTFGCIRGVCAALGLPIEIITPQSWKKHYGLGSDKEVVRAKAIELFPKAPLSRKKDHNRAEALLIAMYGFNQQVQEKLKEMDNDALI